LGISGAWIMANSPLRFARPLHESEASCHP
jgi:hypothetical protein